MRLGEYYNAIKHLKSFSADDILISPAVIGAVGDCYVEMGNVKESVSYFEKAAKKADNALLSPIYLKKAGLAYENLGDTKAAINAYQQIKENYPLSVEANDIVKYIDRAQDKK